MVRAVLSQMAAASATAAWTGFAAASAGSVLDPASVSRVIKMADRDYLDRTARIFKAPDATHNGVPIGDAKFGGVSLGRAGIDESKAVSDPKTHSAIFEPDADEHVSVWDPALQGQVDGLHAVDAISIIIGLMIVSGISFGLYATWKDSNSQKVLKWETERIEKRRLHDLERARNGKDPFSHSVDSIKERIRSGENGESFLTINCEFWEDAARALVEVLVEDREKRIPDGSAKMRRRRAISEVRYLVKGESGVVYKSSWFRRERKKVSRLFTDTTYDNIDAMRAVALARLMTLEKAATSNGRMDWPKAAIEEMRLIDPGWMEKQGRLSNNV